MTDPSTLAITRLTLTDYRNYAALRLDLRARLVALWGANGAGKTNLLEAISLLAPGRGLRGNSFDALARLDGNGSWAIAGEIETAGGGVQLGTRWDTLSGEGRSVMIDGRAQKSSGALGQHMRLLWLTPAMDRLFGGPASDRRRFFDRLVQAFDPEHGSRLAVFEKLMRERNLLLSETRSDGTWISSLEAHMAEAGIAIAAARLTVVDVLRRSIAVAGEGDFPWARIAIEGATESLVATMPAVRAEDEFRARLGNTRHADRAAGRALEGPHRSDFQVWHGPRGMAAGQCSTGEQKALLIGLILAQARAVRSDSGVAPIILLDEVAAHLDSVRRSRLYATLHALGCQVWMSGTDASLFAELGRDAAVFRVEDATVSDVTGNQ